MADKTYTIGVRITGDASSAEAAVKTAEKRLDELKLKARSVSDSTARAATARLATIAAPRPPSPIAFTRITSGILDSMPKLSAPSSIPGALTNILGLAVGLPGVFASAFSIIGRIGSAVFSGLWSGVKFLAHTITNILGGAISLVKHAFLGLGAAAGMAMAGIWAGIKFLKPAGDVEQLSLQTEVLLKSATAAKTLLAELGRLSRSLGMGFAETVQAANSLQVAGIYSERNLKAAADAAALTGKSMEEVIHAIGYLASGRTGEAMESLGRLGVTRARLESKGIRYSPTGGEIRSPPTAVLSATIAILEDLYKGGAARLANTWKGAFAIVGHSITTALAKAGHGLLEYATRAAQALAKGIDALGEAARKINWEKIGTTIEKSVTIAAGFLKRLLDPNTRGNILGPLTHARDIALSAILGPPSLRGKNPGDRDFSQSLTMTFLRDLGSTLSQFASRWSDIGTWLLDGLRLSFADSIGLFRSMFSGVGNEIGDKLRMAWERATGIADIPGSRTSQAEKVYGDAYQKYLRDTAAKTQKPPGESDFIAARQYAQRQQRLAMGWESPEQQGLERNLTAGRTYAEWWKSRPNFKGMLNFNATETKLRELAKGLREQTWSPLAAEAGQIWQQDQGAAKEPDKPVKWLWGAKNEPYLSRWGKPHMVDRWVSTPVPEEDIGKPGIRVSRNAAEVPLPEVERWLGNHRLTPKPQDAPDKRSTASIDKIADFAQRQAAALEAIRFFLTERSGATP